MPIRPSGGKLVFPKPVEYWVAAPSVWDFAYGEMYERFVGKEKKNISPRTTTPAIATSSVYSTPLTVEPSKYPSEKVFSRSFEVELEDGSYNVCPEQVESHFVEGTKRSLLPVSKTTVHTKGQKAICDQMIRSYQ